MALSPKATLQKPCDKMNFPHSWNAKYPVFCIRLGNNWNMCELALACEEAHTYTAYRYSTRGNSEHFHRKKNNLLIHVMINMEHLAEEIKLPAYFWCRSMWQPNSIELSKEKILPTSFFVLALGFLWPNQRQFSPLSQHKIIHFFCWFKQIQSIYLFPPLHIPYFQMFF